ncbi:MAG: hypothetical protein U9532_02715 ['Conium maculatum' witches'-broom phytoplasma]|nr:hypothetical protein ['Conium maculatum' witches'-broom phytoplasma]
MNFILSHNPIYTHNYFRQQTKSKIKLTDYENLQQEWLNTQNNFKRHNINVLDKDDIPYILKYFDIQTSTYDLEEASYNPYNKHFFDPKLKNLLKAF